MSAEGTIPDGPLTLVEVAHLSDTGRVRHHNEDRALVSGGLLAVADGMGGAKAGEVAAQMAVDAVGALGAPVTAADVRAAVGEANRSIRRLAGDEPDKSGMGTTLTAAMMRDGTLEVVHVGGTRIASGPCPHPPELVVRVAASAAPDPMHATAGAVPGAEPGSPAGPGVDVRA